MSKVREVLEQNPNLCNHFRNHRTVFIHGYGNASFTQKIEGVKGLSVEERENARMLHNLPFNEEIYLLIETDQPWFLPVLFPSNHSVVFTDKGISIVAESSSHSFDKFISWAVIKDAHLIRDKFVFETSNGEITIDNELIYSINNKEHYRTDAEVLAKLVHLIAAQYESAEKRLNEMIGLDKVKRKIKVLTNLVKMHKMRQDKGMHVVMPSLHLVFMGNPGTGKTEVARLIAEIFQEIGLLSRGHLVEARRSDLVEKYVGHTAKKVEEVVMNALGGVLFIDEAYALSNGGAQDFGPEAIDTLTPLMENHRENLVVIAAGYTKDMERFLAANQGLSSRFSEVIHFDDYSLDELTQIFEKMCHDRGYELTEAAKMHARKLIMKSYGTDAAKFGNGRGVRNLFEKVYMKQADRLGTKDYVTEAEMTVFEPEDFDISY